MRILRIIPSSQSENENETLAYKNAGVELSFCKMSFLKPMTSMAIATIANKTNIDIVEVQSPDDAMLAISAAKITKSKNFAIVVKLLPNSPTPRSIVDEILQKTDLWVFPSEDMLAEYKKISGDRLRATAVISPTNFDLIEIKSQHKNGSPTLTFAGPITDTNRLRQAIDAVDRHPDTTIKLRICGQGRASEVMPLVRHTRNLECRERINWTGHTFTSQTDIEGTSLCIASARDITPEEITLIANGIDLIEPENIASLPSEIKRKNLPKETYLPEFHVKRITETYSKIK